MTDQERLGLNCTAPEAMTAQFPNFNRLTDYLNSKKHPRKLLQALVRVAKEANV